MYDELKERCRACSQGCIYPSECSYFDKPPLRCMRQLLSEAFDAIEELSKLVDESIPKDDAEILIAEVAKPHWIPVTERLPEKERETYWICTDSGYQCECRWTNNKYGLGESDNWGWHIMDIPQYQKVIAWRELPDPYEPSRGE